jgi:uncharacterized protein (DUF1778 family)
MVDRIQLNLRFDNQRELVEALKEAASREGKSLNRFVIDTLKTAIGLGENQALLGVDRETLDKMIDNRLESLVSDSLDKVIDNKLDTALSQKIDKKLDIVEGLEERYQTLSIEVRSLGERIVALAENPAISTIKTKSVSLGESSANLQVLQPESETINGLTHAELGNRLGVDASTPGRWLKKKSIPKEHPNFWNEWMWDEGRSLWFPQK